MNECLHHIIICDTTLLVHSSLQTTLTQLSIPHIDYSLSFVIVTIFKRSFNAIALLINRLDKSVARIVVVRRSVRIGAVAILCAVDEKDRIANHLIG